VPDIPRLVETRAMLLGGDCRLFGRPDEGHAVVVAGDGSLAAVIGLPSSAEVAEAAADFDGELLAEERLTAHVSAALPGWRGEGAVIHAWGAARPAAPPGLPPTCLLRPADSLEHLPPELRDEIQDARARTAVVVALAEPPDGPVPVAFCYAGSETETLWDVSMDTLEPYRRRGFAQAAFLHLAALLAEKGKSPVWGAVDSNVASLRLAARLGFLPVDRLTVFSRLGVASVVSPA
jgi:hypothetical protein